MIKFNFQFTRHDDLHCYGTNFTFRFLSTKVLSFSFEHITGNFFHLKLCTITYLMFVDERYSLRWQEEGFEEQKVTLQHLSAFATKHIPQEKTLENVTCFNFNNLVS